MNPRALSPVCLWFCAILSVNANAAVDPNPCDPAVLAIERAAPGAWTPESGARFDAGVLAAAQGDPDRAIALLEPLFEVGHARVARALADARWQRGENRVAAEVLRTGIDWFGPRSGEGAELRLDLARVLARQACWQQVDEWLDVPGLREDVHALALRVEALAALRRWPEHARALETLAERTNVADRWIELATAQSRLGEHIAAGQSLGRALALDGLRVDAWVQLGDTHMAAGAPEMAAVAFEQATDLRPEAADVWQRLGDAWQSTERGGWAMNAWLRAGRLDPAVAASIHRGLLAADPLLAREYERLLGR